MLKTKKNGCVHCGRCCGIVIANQKSYDEIAAYARLHGITPVRQGSTCPWFQNERCQVYEVRPLMCRLFGHVPSLRCPIEGVKFVQISSGVEERAMEDEKQACQQHGIAFLHEVCFSVDEIRELTEAELSTEEVEIQ